MLLSLTVQQRAQRCRCGRLLAPSHRSIGTQQACIAYAVCCYRPSNACPCEPTKAAEGCHGLDLEYVHEPEADDPDYG